MIGFIIFYIIDCLCLWIFDPGLDNIGDAFWLGFNIATSIGLGDYTVTTPAARICAILLGIYGVIIVAFIPGLIASYYSEKTRMNLNQSIKQHYEELDDLTNMNSAQKKQLSETLRKEREAR
ncbi:potassium channel family protein [Ileibacterium valens]|uniref:potassium channel family protein n=1 Tax=Ileibacterium valens TaxID=1862668 RepID=UPI0035156A4B